MTYQILHGNNLDILPTLPDNSVDSIVTDPPYELGFMGKKWDSSGIAYSVQLWTECLRVLKPGGHLLSFGGSRTWHRIAVAIEDAGFEVRDSIAWLYGSGFPKSLDISKAIDKAAGAEREVLTKTVEDIFGERKEEKQKQGAQSDSTGRYGSWGNDDGTGRSNYAETAPATPEAEAWNGWGTALKPAFEPVIVARKPLIGTVAQNVLEFGTGGLNIDGCRIEGSVQSVPMADWSKSGTTGASLKRSGEMSQPHPQGRWPANLILDEYTAELLDKQSGMSVSKAALMQPGPESEGYRLHNRKPEIRGHNDSGGASRFFYIAKASKADRNEGLEELQVRITRGLYGEGIQDNRPHTSEGYKYEGKAQNFHPTVKPTQLMRYLICLVTPPGGVVLDPFTGSGSTGKAAILEGFDFIGIELTAEYLPIIEGRLKHAQKLKAAEDAKAEEFLF